MRALRNLAFKAKLACQTHPAVKTLQDAMDFVALFILVVVFAFLAIDIFSATDKNIAVINLVVAYALFTLFERKASARLSAVSMFGRVIGIISLGLLLRNLYLHSDGLFVDVLAYLQKSPGEVLLGFGFALATWLLVKYFIPAKPSYSGQSALSVRAMAGPRKPFEKVGPWSKLTLWDAEGIAAHEAGHAIAFGLFPFLEHDTEAVLQMGVDRSFLDGYCRGNGWRNKVESLTLYDIRMIVILAGVEAERLCLGERLISGTSDHERFIELAKKRLQVDHESIFYNLPKNEFEAKHNSDAIMALKTKYQQIACDLLIANRELLDVIKGGLMEKGRIHGEQFRSLLAQVKPVPGCPVISDILHRALEADAQAFNATLAEKAVA